MTRHSQAAQHPLTRAGRIGVGFGKSFAGGVMLEALGRHPEGPREPRAATSLLSAGEGGTAL